MHSPRSTHRAERCERRDYRLRCLTVESARRGFAPTLGSVVIDDANPDAPPLAGTAAGDDEWRARVHGDDLVLELRAHSGVRRRAPPPSRANHAERSSPDDPTVMR